MKNIYGLTGIRVKVISQPMADLLAKEVNRFLEEYDGNIIDIQTLPPMHDSVQYIIFYKAIED